MFVVLYTPPAEWPGAARALDLVSLLFCRLKSTKEVAPKGIECLLRKQRTTLQSRPRLACSCHALERPFFRPTFEASPAETSYYSGIIKMRV